MTPKTELTFLHTPHLPHSQSLTPVQMLNSRIKLRIKFHAYTLLFLTIDNYFNTLAYNCVIRSLPDGYTTLKYYTLLSIKLRIFKLGLAAPLRPKIVCYSFGVWEICATFVGRGSAPDQSTPPEYIYKPLKPVQL